MAERTLIWDVFDYIFESDRRRMGRIKPIRTYRNPIFLQLFVLFYGHQLIVSA
jgi:hypothetical protein